MASPGGIRAGKAYVEITADATGLQRVATQAAKIVADLGKKIRNVGLAISAAGSAMAAPLALSLRTFEQMGSELNDMSARTGASVENLSQLAHAAGQTGASLADVETSIKKMQKAIGEGKGSGIEKLGLNLKQLAKLSVDDQFDAVARAIAGIEGPTKRAAAALAVFGKTGTALLPAIADMAALRDEAERLNLTISTDMAERADALGDSFGRVAATAKRVQMAIGNALAPAMTELANNAAQIVAELSRWIDANQELVVIAATVTAGIVASGTALVVFGTGLQVASAALSGFGNAFAMLTSPMGLVLAGVAAVGAAILYYTDIGGVALKWLGEQFKRLSGWVTTVMEAIQNALNGGDIGAAADVLWAALLVAWETGIKPLREAWGYLWDAMQRVFIEASAAIESLWVKFTSWLWEKFPDAMKFATTRWVTTWDTIAKEHSDAVDYMADKWLWFMSLFEDFDRTQIDAARAMLEREGLEGRLEGISQTAATQIAEANRKAQRTPAQIEADKNVELAKIEARKAAELAKIAKERGDAIAAAEKNLADKQKALADAIAVAAALEPLGPGAGAGRPGLPGPDEDGIKKKLETLDMSMGAGGPRSTFAQERAAFGKETVQIGEKQLKKLDQIELNTRIANAGLRIN